MLHSSAKKILARTLKLLLVVYAAVCIFLYFFQEKFIFFPDKLEPDFRFSFHQRFEERNVMTRNKKLLNGILFFADSSKGLVFYLHGNAGALDSWGEVAKRYTELNYDVFLLDYPGYGKSQGFISSQKQVYDAIQDAYNEMKKTYAEQRIVVLGYSIGSGPAAKLASVNHPRLLILQAAYYSLKNLMQQHYPFIPTFLLKYRFETNRYLEDCSMPVVLFHGDHDEVISYHSSEKLKAHLKNTDTLIILTGQGHNGMTDNTQYMDAIRKILD